MQPCTYGGQDGNLVLSDGHGTPIWYTGTYGHFNTTLYVSSSAFYVQAANTIGVNPPLYQAPVPNPPYFGLAAGQVLTQVRRRLEGPTQVCPCTMPRLPESSTYATQDVKAFPTPGGDGQLLIYLNAGSVYLKVQGDGNLVRPLLRPCRYLASQVEDNLGQAAALNRQHANRRCTTTRQLLVW